MGRIVTLPHHATGQSGDQRKSQIKHIMNKRSRQSSLCSAVFLAAVLSGNVDEVMVCCEGMTELTDPVDVAEDARTGVFNVSELVGKKPTLLKQKATAG